MRITFIYYQLGLTSARYQHVNVSGWRSALACIRGARAVERIFIKLGFEGNRFGYIINKI